jgi:hypothetical protein
MPDSGRAIVIPLAIEFRVNLMIYFGRYNPLVSFNKNSKCFLLYFSQFLTVLEINKHHCKLAKTDFG